MVTIHMIIIEHLISQRNGALQEVHHPLVVQPQHAAEVTRAPVPIEPRINASLVPKAVFKQHKF